MGGFGGQTNAKPDSTSVAPTPQSTQGTNAVSPSNTNPTPQDTSKMNPTQQSFGWDWQSGVQSTIATLQSGNPVHPGTHWNWSQPTLEQTHVLDPGFKVPEVNLNPVKAVVDQAEKKAERVQCLEKKAEGYLARIGSFFGVSK